MAPAPPSPQPAGPRRLQLPLSEVTVRDLHAADFVLLSGTLYTARDAVHSALAGGETPPCNLVESVLYHCGPVVTRTAGGWEVVAAGPTTSIREEPYAATLIQRFGLRALIGKGGMGEHTLAACGQYGCVYLHAVGGAAQVLAAAVEGVQAVHWLDRLGSPEAILELRVKDFPALVTMDTHGVSLHAAIEKASRARLAALCPVPD